MKTVCYGWGRFGTLVRFNGMPVYLGGRLITRWVPVWWWPLNWVIPPIYAVYAAIKLATKAALKAIRRKR